MEMMTAFRIHGQVPAKKNSKQLVPVRGKTIIVSSKAYKIWEEHALVQLKEFAPSEPLTMPVHIHIDFVFKDNRARDLSNLVESVHDAMVKAGILLDDNNRIIVSQSSAFIGVDKVNAGAIITLRYEGSNTGD